MSLFVTPAGGCHYNGLLPRESIKWYVLKKYNIKIRLHAYLLHLCYSLTVLISGRIVTANNGPVFVCYGLSSRPDEHQRLINSSIAITSTEDLSSSVADLTTGTGY